MRPKTAQEIQDEVLRKLSIREKLRLVDGFYKLARKFNPLYFEHGFGTGSDSKHPEGSSRDSE